MSTISRRNLCTLLPALAGVLPAIAQDQPAPATATPPGETLGSARAISVDQMQQRKTATGQSWNIVHGSLPTGETVNLHASTQDVGAPPVELHVIHHTEFLLVRQGDVEFRHEVDGKVVAERVTAGGVLYIPTGTRHAVHNVGSVPASYFVVGIGGDAR